MVILTHTDPEGAIRVGERIRQRIAGHPFGGSERQISITASLGTSTVIINPQ